MGLSTRDSEKAGIIGNSLGVVVTPVQKLFSNITKKIDNTVEFISEIKYLKERNEELIVENDKLKEENRVLSQLDKENDRLREMLGLADKYDNFEIVAAEVIAKEFSNWHEIFTIDKGIEDGLEKECVVITNKGLVGYIFEIGSTYAKVMTILDNDCIVSSILERSRDNVIVRGELQLQENARCKMTYITKDTDIIKGDNVITSGMGGIYPKNLLIGNVEEIHQDPFDLSYYAIVNPIVDFKRLEEVFVIKK
jgi:rod shape-determining protein MreC